MPRKITRRSFVASAAVGIAVSSGLEGLWRANGADLSTGQEGSVIHLPPIRLRGYGTISAVFRRLPAAGGESSLTQITCEGPERALLVQAKYLSDISLMGATSEDSLPLGTGAVPIRQTVPGGAIACCARGRDVSILAAATKPDLADLCGRFLPPAAPAASFTSRVPVPMYLDRFDRYGLLIYYGPFTTPPSKEGDPPYDFAKDFRFLEENGHLGLVVWDTPAGDDTAEGLSNEPYWDWVQRECRARRLPLHVNTSFSFPLLWLGNRYREETMLKAPQFLGGYYGVAHDTAGVGAVSWHSQAAEDVLLGIVQHTVKRFASDPNIVGWLEPHGETSEEPQSLLIEYGPVADRSLRKYLRTKYTSLRAVSQRWFGDPGRLRLWEDIRTPELAEFLGLGPDAIDLRGTWRVRPVSAPDGHVYSHGEARGLPSPPPTAPVPPEWFQPGFDESGWDSLVAPGNDRMLFMTRSPTVYRRTVEVPADWLARHPQPWLYVWDLVSRERDVITLSINGQPVTRAEAGSLYAAFDVSQALRPGANLVVLEIPRAIICYRMYLSPDAPAQYPDLGPEKNARWADFSAWITWSRAAQIRRGAEMIRQVDPDRPINYMAPDDHAGAIKQVVVESGGQFHDTGAMAGFWDEHDTLLMRGSGLPCTAEPGNGAPDAEQLQAFWGRWITEGLNGVHYFQHLGEILWNPGVLEAFKDNLRMYQTIGKYHVPFAEVAVLYSTRNERLTSFPWNPHTDRWSTGGYWRSNQAWPLIRYCPRDGVTEEDFVGGSVDRYRVVIDSNTTFMTDEVLASIEIWVRAGGVFVTYGQTGRHTETHPDMWPIRRLTGYDVIDPHDPDVYHKGVTLRPSTGQTMFPAEPWSAGIRTGGLALRRAAPECEDLMLWSDGTVAVGMRPLGKGRIIHVGAAPGGGATESLLTQIVGYFGVKRVPAMAVPAPGLHFRHFITNTGLQDIWVLFNESGKALTTDLTFLPGVHPASLTEINTGKTVEIARDPAGDAVRGIQLGPWKTVMYVSPRTDTAVSPLEWLKLQRGWWQGTTPPPARPLPTPAQDQRFLLDLGQDWAFKPANGLGDEQAALLTQPGIDATGWKRRDLGIWGLSEEAGVRRAILRRRFTVPDRWTNGGVSLCLQREGGIFWDQGRIFLDGQLLHNFGNDGIYLDPAGGVLKPGTTHVLALDVVATGVLGGTRTGAWLYFLPEPQDRQDLAGEWGSYSDALTATGPQQIPGSVKAAFLSRTVTISAAHRNRNVVIHVETARPVHGVIINGSYLNRRFYWGSTMFWINVTPFVKFGEENLVELVADLDPAGTLISRIEIRYYDKDVYA